MKTQALLKLTLGLALIAILLFLVSYNSFTDNSVKSTYVNIDKDYLQKDTLVDSRDGKKYGIVKIGSITWMSENLNYKTKGGDCFNDDSSYCQKYGRIYNWETAMKACPKGWHLPRDKEWQILFDFAGGSEVAGKKLKAKSGWISFDGNRPDRNCNGTDVYGFSALPGGRHNQGYDIDILQLAQFWSSSEPKAGFAYCPYILECYDYIGERICETETFFNWLSVRCVQD